MKNKLQSILGHVRRADNDFNLIQNGDRIVVGVSGGKDSLLLLQALSSYKKFGTKKSTENTVTQQTSTVLKTFDIIAVTIDCSGGKIDYGPIKAFCEGLEIKYIVEPSNIFEIIFDIRKEKNPCSLCSKLRRGMLNSVANRENCNKVALGHHSDDLIETFFLSLLYEGRVSTFQPISYLDRTDITVIRPLIYVSEKEVNAFAKTLPVLHNPCPANHHTQREYMKNLIKKISTDIPIAHDRMTTAITTWLSEKPR